MLRGVHVVGQGDVGKRHFHRFGKGGRCLRTVDGCGIHKGRQCPVHNGEDALVGGSGVGEGGRAPAPCVQIHMAGRGRRIDIADEKIACAGNTSATGCVISRIQGSFPRTEYVDGVFLFTVQAISRKNKRGGSLASTAFMAVKMAILSSRYPLFLCDKQSDSAGFHVSLSI